MNNFTNRNGAKYENIAMGLMNKNSFSKKALEREKARKEINFNSNSDSITKALNSKSGEYINSVIDAVKIKKAELEMKLSMNGYRNNEDVLKVKEYKEALRQLEDRVSDLKRAGLYEE